MKQPTFIIELLRRFISANPPFFKKIQLLSAIVVVITEIPNALEMLSITVPEWLLVVENKFVTLGAFITLVLAQTPNVDKPVVKTSDEGGGDTGGENPLKPPPTTPNP